MDQHDNAINAFAEVYELAMQRGEYPLALYAQKHLVKQAIATSNVDAVISHARAALDLLSTHISDAVEQAAFEDMLLLGLMSSEKYAEAKVKLQQIIEKADADSDQLRLLTAYGKLGDTNYALGELDTAVKRYVRAVNLAVRHHDKPVEVQLIGRLAAVHADLGDLDKSIEFAQRAIASGSQIEDWETVGEQYVILALNAQQSGQLDDAIANCKSAVEVLQRSGAQEKQSRANELLQSLQVE